MSFSPTFCSRGSELSSVIRKHAQTLDGQFLDRLAAEIGRRNCKVVCIGEASHGTHEFYQLRAELSKRLIAEYGFDGVCIEGDWPDTWRVNRYVQGIGPEDQRDQSANEALSEFKRFPTWMWRNRVVESFVEWLKQHNEIVKRYPDRETVQDTSPLGAGFYGMDLYSLFCSMDAIVDYLEKVDKEAAQRARERFECFEQGARRRGERERDAQVYGQRAAFGMSKACQNEVIEQLKELQKAQYEKSGNNGDEFFSAQLNALLVKNAENYYRNMFMGEEPSWNMRDRHMSDTVHELIKHIERKKQAANLGDRPAKLILWAHNSHLGDARATEMGLERGELNVGQLMRESFGDATHNLGCYNIGFTSHSGTVTAAHNWNTPDHHMIVNPGREGSYEHLMHMVRDGHDFGLIIRGNSELTQTLRMPRLERAIGVIYRPRTELQSHYFQAYLSQQFDAIMHVDRSHAIEPLDPQDHWIVARSEYLRVNPSHVPRTEAESYEPGPKRLKVPVVEDHGRIPPETYPFGV